MPDKANFTRAEASVQLALVKKKGDYIACVADGFFSLWTGSLFGEKNSEEREGKRGGGVLFPFPIPLDQRPVHGLMVLLFKHAKQTS